MLVKGDRHRCDGCGKVSENQDKFASFVMPPSVNARTGQPDGRFNGIAKKSDPTQLVELHACPSCKPKIKTALTTYDFATIPDGPLKKVLNQVMSRDRLRSLKVI